MYSGPITLTSLLYIRVVRPYWQQNRTPSNNEVKPHKPDLESNFHQRSSRSQRNMFGFY